MVARTMGRGERTIQAPLRSTPVVAEVDMGVVGGGPWSVGAHVAAALLIRAGVSPGVLDVQELW
jgi:hypothetical protein